MDTGLTLTWTVDSLHWVSLTLHPGPADLRLVALSLPHLAVWAGTGGGPVGPGTPPSVQIWLRAGLEPRGPADGHVLLHEVVVGLQDAHVDSVEEVTFLGGDLVAPPVRARPSVNIFL